MRVKEGENLIEIIYYYSVGCHCSCVEGVEEL